MERIKLKNQAKKALTGKFTPLVLSLLVFVIISTFGSLLDLLLNVNYLSGLFSAIAAILFGMGFINSVMKVARGQNVDVNNLFKHTHLGLKYLLIGLVTACIIGLLLLLLAIAYKSLSTVLMNTANISFLPYAILVITGSVLSVVILMFMIYLAVSFSQVYFILNDNPEAKIGDIIAESFDMLDGYRAEYIMLCLSFVGWIILGIFTLGILYLWVVPYMMVTLAKFYDELKEKYSYSKTLTDEEVLLLEKENASAKKTTAKKTSSVKKTKTTTKTPKKTTTTKAKSAKKTPKKTA